MVYGVWLGWIELDLENLLSNPIKKIQIGSDFSDFVIKSNPIQLNPLMIGLSK